MKKQVFIYCFLFVWFTANAQTENRWLNIVYIGNSITEGVLLDNPNRNAPPVKASIYLQKQLGIGEIKYSNQGVSGKTTVDFLPETNTFFPKVVAAADKLKTDTWATLVFSIMLGTNDSATRGPNGSPVSPQQYYRNMKAIIDKLLELYPDCKIILHRPIWYSGNTYNSSMYLQEGLDRLNSYYPQIQALVNSFREAHPDQVYIGDTEAFDYFEQNHLNMLIPENGNAGTFYLHPNEEGAAKLGEFWGKAIYTVLQ